MILRPRTIAVFSLFAMGIFTVATLAQDKAEGEVSNSNLETLLENINSPEFFAREAAMQALWEAGREAETKLREEEANTTSPEARLRLRQVLDKFDFGIYPDTPAETIALIHQFRSGNQEDRRLAIMELCEDNQFELAMRLIRTISNPELRNRLSDSFARAVDEKIVPLILAEKFDKTGELLYDSAVNREAMIDYAVYVSIRGELATKLERQQKVFEEEGGAITGELLHWLLRADSQFEEATRIAEEIGQPDLAREATILGGDLIAFVESAADLRLDTIQSHSFKLARHRLANDETGAAAQVEIIRKYAQEHPREYMSTALALGLNGYVEEAFETVRPHNLPQVCSWYLGHDKIDDALKIIGVEEGSTDAVAIATALGQMVWKANDASEQGLWIRVGAEFAKLFGKSEAGHQFFDTLFENALAIEVNLSLNIIGHETQQGLLEQARAHAAKAIENGANQDDVLTYLCQDGTSSKRSWFSAISEQFPDAERDDVFKWLQWLLLPDLAGRTEEQVAKVEEILKWAEENKLQDEAFPGVQMNFNDPRARLNFRDLLFNVCVGHHMWDRAVKFALHDQEPGNWESLARAGTISAYQKKWDEAAKYYKEAWEIDQTVETNLFLYGWALAKGNRLDEGERLMRKARLLMRGDFSTRLIFAESTLLRFGLHDWATDEADLAYNLSDPFDNQHSKAVELLSRLVSRKDPQRGEFLAERILLDEMEDEFRRSVSFHFHLNTLYRTKKMAAILRGDVKTAFDAIERSLAYGPSNSSVIEDGFRELADLGSKDEVESVYERIHAEAKQLTDRYPHYAQGHNNLAWLNARCGRRLDEALEHANTAVKMMPRSGAYLDTLAEVHFARGDFRKAVEISDRSLEFLRADPQLREQNDRFHAGLREHEKRQKDQKTG
ncbi:MAG: hypothetical protein AAGA58_11975 [Verrucomicrobiota bacterium]